MELSYDAVGFELQLCCHHVLLLGDLNYRVALSTAEAIDRMARGAWEELLSAEQLTQLFGFGTKFKGTRTPTA